MPIAVPLTEDEAFLAMMVVGSLPMFLMGVNVVTGACFLQGPGSLHAGGRRTVSSVALLTAWQYWMFVPMHHVPRLVSAPRGLPSVPLIPQALLTAVEQGELAFIAYHAAMALWLLAWWRAVRADPVCPRKTAELADAARHGDEEEEKVRRLHRAAGCRTCREIGGGSVPGFDHYCPLVANAVGRANRKAFVLTLVYQLCSGAILLRDAWPEAAAAFGGADWHDVKTPQVVVGTVLAVHVNLVCAFLLSAQVAALLLGISTLELWAALPWAAPDPAHALRRPSWPSWEQLRRELGPRRWWLVPTTTPL